MRSLQGLAAAVTLLLPAALAAPPAPASPAAASPASAAAALPVPSAAAAPAPAPGRSDAGPDHLAIARAELRARAAGWGLTAAEADAAGVLRRHDLGHGPVVMAFRRSAGGVEVLDEQAAVVLTRAGRPVATLGALDGGRPRPGERFTLGAAAAAARGLLAVAGPGAATAPLSRGREAGPWQAFDAPGGAVARVRRAWLPDGGALAARWLVEVTGPLPAGRLPEVAVLDDAGEVRARRPLAQAQAYAWRAWAEPAGDHRPWDAPTGSGGSPHPTGLADGTQPPVVAQSLVTLAHASATRADPWLPDGAAETTGNNAAVYANLDGNTGFTAGVDVRGVASGPGAFDHLADVSLDPSAGDNRQAGLAQAFYLVNWLHDWLADAGFDEAAGNAQQDNLGRGGLGGDPLVVELQDPGVANNAYMVTPADGASPVLRVATFGAVYGRYVAWDGTPPPGRPANEEATRSAFGLQAFDLAAPLRPVDDGVAPVTDGCDDGPWATEDLSGEIALLDAAGCTTSTTCSCADKAARAQARHAAGVIIANDAPGYLFLAFQSPDARVTVPVLGVTQATGDAFRAAAAASPSGTAAVRMHRTAAGPRRDGAVDSLLLTHEWGHLLSGRLVGGGGTLINNHSMALGEGWSDFLALLLSARAGDGDALTGAPYGGAYTYGAWVLGGPDALFGGPNQAWYFGMRRVPYTTDLARNALTFRHVQEGEPLPLATPGGAAIPFADNGLGNAEVHNAGEVWATMLWECYAGLLRDTTGPSPRLDFAEAERRMREYLVASLVATPAVPTYLEARDALLAVVEAGGDAADLARFWEGFARRGAGVGAEGPPRGAADNRPVVESYLTPEVPPPPPPPPPPADPGGGGCQAGGAGPLSLAALASLGALRRRRRIPGGEK